MRTHFKVYTYYTTTFLFRLQLAVKLNTSTMASFVEKFSTVSACEYKKCSELTIGAKYPIDKLTNDSTKYGPTVIAIIQDYTDANKTIKVYLPKRYAGRFTDEELSSIQPNTLHLVYLGQKDRMTNIEIVQ